VALNFCSGERGLQWNIFFDNDVLGPSRGIYPWRPFIFIGIAVLQQNQIKRHHVLTQRFGIPAPFFSVELPSDKLLK
jgi:hypothetical protein